MIKTQPLLAIAKELGVSDSGIRGRAKRRGINIKELSRWSKKHGSFS
jgi:transposase-like protein